MSGLPELKPVPYGGYHIKTTPTHRILAYRQLFNWRLVTAPVEWDETAGFDHGWCYFGTGPETLLAVLCAARLWDGAEGTEPPGYDKRAF